jgi:putative tryptophan/tyrosine transport system substrate-binding protein
MLPVRRIVILFDPNSTRAALDGAVVAARTLGLEAEVREVAAADDFGAAFEAVRTGRTQAIDVLGSPFFNANKEQLIDLAARYRLPAMYESDEFVSSGGLFSYGARLVDLFRRSASYVDRILKGAKPGDLPVEQWTKFELVINAKTARALGLAIPPSILARADEVIE